MAEKIKLGSNGNFGVKEGGTLAYNDENGVFKAIELASSRASGATYVAQSGLIADAEVGVPRIDYTNGVGELLLEPQRRNNMPYSEDIANVGWVKSASGTGVAPIVVANQGTSLDGTMNADRVTFNVTAPSDRSTLADTITVVNGRSYNGSFYAKAWSASDVGKIILLRHVGSTTYTPFTLTAEWQRFDTTELSNTTSATYSIELRPDLGSSTGIVDVLIWGAQLEDDGASGGADYPTSYIRTSGSAVTRIADAVTGNSSLGQVINSSEGVLYFEGSGFDDNNVYWSLNDDSNNNMVFLGITPTNSFYAQIRSGASTQADMSGGTYQDRVNFKAAIKYKQDDFALWINGTEVATGLSGVTPLLMDSLKASWGNASFPFYGRIRELKVYDTALTDAELTTLTTL